MVVVVVVLVGIAKSTAALTVNIIRVTAIITIANVMLFMQITSIVLLAALTVFQQSPQTPLPAQ